MEPNKQAKLIFDKYLKLLIKNTDFSKPQTYNVKQTAKECAISEVEALIKNLPDCEFYDDDLKKIKLELESIEMVKI